MAQTGASYVGKTTKQTNEIPLCFVFSSFLYLESCKFASSFMFHEQITSSTLHGACEHSLICQAADTFSAGCCKILCSKMLVGDLNPRNNPASFTR